MLKGSDRESGRPKVMLKIGKPFYPEFPRLSLSQWVRWAMIWKMSTGNVKFFFFKK